MFFNKKINSVVFGRCGIVFSKGIKKILYFY